MGFGLAVSGGAPLVGGIEVGVAFWEDWEAANSGVGGGGVRFLMARDSRVWRVGSSVGDWGGGMETAEGNTLAVVTLDSGAGGSCTWRLFGK